MLGLPLGVISHLRTENIITSRRVRKQYQFERGSVEEFQKVFNRDDYLSKREFDKEIEGYRTEVLQPTKNPKKPLGIHDHPVGIYVSGKRLITGGGEIPDEYRVEVKEFGTAQYITKKSAAKTIEWLKKLQLEYRPPSLLPEVDWANRESDVKKDRMRFSRKRRLGKRTYPKQTESEVKEFKRWEEKIKREKKERDEQFKMKAGFSRLKYLKRSVPA